jgi:hypothetical protein
MPRDLRFPKVPVPSGHEFRFAKHIRHTFYADLWAHNMSYLSGFIGGISLCVIVWRGRGRAITSATVGSERP